MNGYHPEERLIDSASLGEEWVDLSFAIGKTPILKRVTGIASPGRLTGVMGPSGSGKTTLLNVLSGRQRTSGYSRTGSNKQEDSSNVITGGPLRKGLSGGQQKRVAVGVELISNPQMIFLDEPISGLDSYNAFTLMQSLNKLSRTGVPVVLTIHQPSSEIYDLIDDVIFLCKGDVIYQGPRWGLFSHFEQLGFRCPANHNPADFVMFLIHKEDDEVLDQLIGNWRTSTACKQLTTRIMHAGDGR
eukprot:g2507.t1